tara:strand:+ start:547 stop:843 length:297 start_codon:yes stop_codon:yes gene_type:complete
MFGKTKSLFLCVAMLSGFASAAQADEVKIPIAQQGTSIETPRTGISSAAVLQQFGQPEQQVSAIGEPPISRWVYPSFTVYFEYDHVITTVKHHKRQDQ